MQTFTIEVPDILASKCGGESVEYDMAKMPLESVVHAFRVGFDRLNSYGYSSAKAQALNPPDKPKGSGTWLPSDHRAQIESVKARFYDGDWQRSAGPRAESDPVGALATTMAKDAILAILATAAGLDATKAIPRASTIRDNANADVAMKLAKYGVFNGKNGNTYEWNGDAVAAYVDSAGFRAKAEAEIKRRESKLADVDLTGL